MDMILECIHNGITDKQKIYSAVEKKSGFPRATIRRAARQLRIDMQGIISILQSERPRSSPSPRIVKGGKKWKRGMSI